MKAIIAQQNENIRRLAPLAREFNDACGAYFRENPDMPEKFRKRLNHEQNALLSLYARELAEWENERRIYGPIEQLENGAARMVLAFCNLFLELAENTGLEKEFTPLFPAEARTGPNEALCRRLGLDHLARVCAPA